MHGENGCSTQATLPEALHAARRGNYYFLNECQIKLAHLAHAQRNLFPRPVPAGQRDAYSIRGFVYTRQQQIIGIEWAAFCAVCRGSGYTVCPHCQERAVCSNCDGRCFEDAVVMTDLDGHALKRD